jgi:hypothetical protein
MNNKSKKVIIRAEKLSKFYGKGNEIKAVNELNLECARACPLALKAKQSMVRKSKI